MSVKSENSIYHNMRLKSVCFLLVEILGLLYILKKPTFSPLGLSCLRLS